MSRFNFIVYIGTILFKMNDTSSCPLPHVGNITSLSVRNTKNILSIMGIQVYECMPLYDVITTEFVGPEVRKVGLKRLILSCIGTCPG